MASNLPNREAEIDRLSEQLLHSYEELNLVYSLGSKMTVDGETEAFLAEALEETADVIAARAAAIIVWDRQFGPANPVRVNRVDIEPNHFERLERELQQLFTGEQAEAPFLSCNEIVKHPTFHWFAPAATQMLAVPLRRAGRTIGCIYLLDRDVAPDVFGIYNDGVFTSVERKLLNGVSAQLSVYLDNRRLFDSAESMMMGFLHSMVAAVDAKDTYTRGHSVRVALFARRLAEELGYEADRCDRVYLSGLLHDVGKIGVEDAVIRKPGGLTDDEFAKIKQHPEIGYRILKSVPHIEDALPGVLYHHEKVNGRGYPHGLVGDAIPELGRLMCIADSFDAMTSSRTYRPARPVAEALEEVRRCAGTHFDAAMAEAFCSIPEPEFHALIATERQGGPVLPGTRAERRAA
jgi:HD-GYP domain-containing protein (c-di-GMP phosphodiesterase class II)